MNFSVRTKIPNTTKEAVMKGLDRSLFLRLAPPFPKLKLLRFDGSERGNEIHLKLNFIFYKKIWISLVTEHGSNEQEIYFVDEGIALPPPLQFWQHRHFIFQVGPDVELEDNITYRSRNKGLDILLRPFFYFVFAYRKPIYKKYLSGLK